jgi:ABC-type uncharacterized transport system fused permease/ATPase subunit
MSSVQLAHALKRKVQNQSRFLTPKRKALAVVAVVLFAGGGLAYNHSNRQRQKPIHHPLTHAADTDDGEEVAKAAAKGRSSGVLQKGKQKRGGLKSVKVVSAILLAHMGKRGMENLVSLAAIAVLRTALGNRLARVQGFLFRAAFLRRVPLFMQLISENLVLCLLQSVLVSTTRFLTGTLSLCFRKILTDRVHADYFQNLTYYKMSHVDHRISNAEQRIASDIPRFCAELSDLIQEDIMAIFDACLYTWRLCSYAHPKYAFSILAYVLGAGVITGVLSPPFGRLMSTEQQLEGEYRQLHSRIRTHSESIAFYGGQVREASIIKQRFKALVKHLGKVLHTQWWFGMIQDCFLKYLGATFAVVLIIGPFFGGNLRPDSSTLGRAKMLSNMRYHTSVIISLFQAMGTLASSSRRLSRVSGYADRIRELIMVARELRIAGGSKVVSNRDSDSYFAEAKYIEFEGVKVSCRFSLVHFCLCQLTLPLSEILGLVINLSA